MERGEAKPAPTIHEKEEIVMVPELAADGDEATGSTPAASTAVSDLEEAGEHEGFLISAEWREGPHQVIERRSGPDGEVR